MVAATSEEGRVVTNGMSQYSRAERNANSAIVVGISPEQDYPGDPLAGIRLQRELEANAYKLGGENYDAPAQKIGDFLKGRDPSELGDVQPSFTPGIKLTDLSKALPAFAIDAIREAIPAFDRQIKGFASEDGLLTGVETRTSSPVCIKRGKDYQSINLKGFYPAGKARATRVVFCRRVLMASKWPKPLRVISSSSVIKRNSALKHNSQILLRLM
ncbi:hypothetical protein PCI56_08160 [Plesiomonas shigelloides subsp. oncorhynchi]|nr:hypothetical protein [Plesiomonas shigelloides]